MNIEMARLARKQMADVRALEEEAERMNPLNKINNSYREGYTGIIKGSGATPSMGLSQFRGGKKHGNDASAQGEALAEHLHSLHGSGYARDFHSGMAMAGGLGTGRYEGEGKMHGGFWGALATLAAPLLGKLLGQGKMTKEGHDEFMSEVRKRIADDKEEGEMTYLGKKQMEDMLKDPAVMRKAMKQKSVQGQIEKGKKGKKQEAARAMVEMSQGQDEEAAQTLKKMRGKGKMKGCGNMQRMVGAGELVIHHGGKQSCEMEGAGPISSLGIPIISNIAGLFGLGKEGKKMKKEKRIVGAGDGRRKRAEVVRRVMKEKGMKMIEASKYVKEHNLY